MPTITSIDTEGTGLSLNDRVISVGIIAANLDFDAKTCKYLGFIELYNTVDRPIKAGARAKHGISNLDLQKLAKGKTVFDVGPTVAQAIQMSNYVCMYNAPFDTKMLVNTYGPNCCVQPEQILDAMRIFNKQHGYITTLETAIARIKKTEEFEEEFNSHFSKVSFSRYHSAVYDAFVTLRLYCVLEGLQWIF